MQYVSLKLSPTFPFICCLPKIMDISDRYTPNLDKLEVFTVDKPSREYLRHNQPLKTANSSFVNLGKYVQTH